MHRSVSKLGAVIPRTHDDAASGGRSHAPTCREGGRACPPFPGPFPLHGRRSAPGLRLPLTQGKGACLPPFPGPFPQPWGAPPPAPIHARI